MFCPLCKAEYRAGFTRCNGCDAELVPSLDSIEAASSIETTVEELWHGQDHAKFIDLVTELSEAGVPFYVGTTQRNHEGIFSLRVLQSDFSRAQTILAALGYFVQDDEEAPPEANVAVWEGCDVGFAQMLRACLRENGIPYRTLLPEMRTSILVRPEEESSAAEIVRQLQEGNFPPEEQT